MMKNSLLVFDEPTLEFRYKQKMIDPKKGLAIFGAHDIDAKSSPVSLNYALLGIPSDVAAFSNWSEAMNTSVSYAPNRNYDLWVPYPGFEAAFGASWPTYPVKTHNIEEQKLIYFANLRDRHERAFEVVNSFLEGLRIISKMDEKVGVAVCVVPDQVFNNCRPESETPPNAQGPTISEKRKLALKYGQLDMFDPVDPSKYWLSPDFRRQLKARAMEFGIPIQIVRRSTLRLTEQPKRGERALTPISDRMWNLGTTLYYKCGGKPWKLATARDGVCYIGIAFRRTDDNDTACCAAQMFLNDGDGIIFMGEFGPWYSPKSKQFHLDKEAASKLLEGVLKTYSDLEGKELKEVFLHSRSQLDQPEIEGFVQACPQGVKLVCVRVRQEDSSGFRLYRLGSMPIIRGSFLRLDEKNGYLWGTGFKEELNTYDGWETPIPLKITIQYGDVAVERVAQDILSLTKLNYNTCKIGDSQPVTIGFSDGVGEILISNPRITYRRPNFKYYI